MPNCEKLEITQPESSREGEQFDVKVLSGQSERETVESIIARQVMGILVGRVAEVVCIDDMSVHASHDEALDSSALCVSGVDHVLEKKFMEGKITLSNGQCFEVAIQLSMSQKFLTKYGRNVLLKRALSEPLDVHYGGDKAQLNRCTFQFEFDSDEYIDTVTLLDSKRFFWFINPSVEEGPLSVPGAIDCEIVGSDPQVPQNDVWGSYVKRPLGVVSGWLKSFVMRVQC